jgi:hypothetical protein
MLQIQKLFAPSRPCWTAGRRRHCVQVRHRVAAVSKFRLQKVLLPFRKRDFCIAASPVTSASLLLARGLPMSDAETDIEARFGEMQEQLEKQVKLIGEQDQMIKNLNESDKTQNSQIGVFIDYVKRLGINVALGFAGQPISRGIGHDCISGIGRPFRDATDHRTDSNHWGQNLVTFMCNHFATEKHEQFFIAYLWDKVRRTRIIA